MSSHQPRKTEMTDKLAIPTIHLNGTSPVELRQQYQDAAMAVSAAIDVLAKSAPNGRDYYPQGDDAFAGAQRQHRARMEKLQSVYAELEEVFCGIDG